MDFAATLGEHKGFPMLVLSGELDMAVEQSLKGTIADLVDHHPCALAQLSDVSYSDAASLGLIMDARDVFRTRNGRLAFVCCQSDLLRALEMLGFTRRMDLFDDLDDAAAFLKAQCP